MKERREGRGRYERKKKLRGEGAEHANGALGGHPTSATKILPGICGSDSEKLGRVRRGARVFATGAIVYATAARAVQQLGQLQQLQQRRLDAGFAEVTRKN